MRKKIMTRCDNGTYLTGEEERALLLARHFS